ncbi:MAG TPA: virulence-associated E family protein [Nitrospira sp.]|nr:virulence-associated E family protein [Nitrospira sp.]
MSQTTTRSPNYLVTQQNQKRPIHSHVITCLNTHDVWAGKLAFNKLTKRTIVRGTPWDPTTKAWTEHDDIMLTDWLARHEGLFIHSPSVISQSVETVAHENEYHPVVEYLNSLDWDGESRLDTWLQDYLGCAANDTQSERYLAEVGRCTLISAVARAYKPGCKVDTCLILEGGQGRFKSTAVRTLAGDWYTDDLRDITSKDASLQIQTWVVELSELDSLTRAEASHIKAFISRQVDRFRPPYGKRIEEYPRPGIFIGTVNPSEYLKDDTGARRFWPVETGHIHVEWLAQDRDQLWAEAKTLYLMGSPWWMDSGARAELAKPMEESRRVKDPWEDEVMNFANAHVSNGARYVTLRDIEVVCLDFKTAARDQRVDNRVASILRAHDWKRGQFRTPAGRVWGYFPEIA